MKISEKKIKNLIRERVRERLAQIVPAGKIIHPDDICTYMRLGKEQTNVDTNIYADDCGSFKMFNHPTYTLFQNGDEFIPINIEGSYPKLVSNNFKLKISQEAFRDVFRFILNNRENIIKLAKEEISQREFANILNKEKK